MFTIDLLKGEGIPEKSRPEGIAIGVVTFAVPIVIAIVVLGFYTINGITMSIQKRNALKYVEMTERLSAAVKEHESLVREKNAISSSLSEVASSIGRHIQWSPVLATLVQNIPASMVLTKLEVKQQSIKKRVPSKADPETMVAINIPKRTLQMTVCGSSQYECDRAVKNFKDQLRYSTLLGPKLEDIRVSQEYDTLEGQPIVSYQIDCAFKPGL